MNKIGIDDKTKTYIQSIVLKKTLEAMSFDYRRHSMLKGVRREAAINDAFEETAKVMELQNGDELAD